MWVVCCQTGVASNFVFWTFSYVVVIAYETILMKNFSFSDVKEIEKFKKKFFLSV
jgi:hypothetical protein